MPPRKDTEPRLLGPRGEYGFTWNLPHMIHLPYPLPKPVYSGQYWAAAENIVAAYNAGFAAAAMADRPAGETGRARSKLDRAA